VCQSGRLARKGATESGYQALEGKNEKNGKQQEVKRCCERPGKELKWFNKRPGRRMGSGSKIEESGCTVEDYCLNFSILFHSSTTAIP
jgi:hypothetical protein